MTDTKKRGRSDSLRALFPSNDDPKFQRCGSLVRSDSSSSSLSGLRMSRLEENAEKYPSFKIQQKIVPIPEAISVNTEGDVPALEKVRRMSFVNSVTASVTWTEATCSMSSGNTTVSDISEGFSTKKNGAIPRVQSSPALLSSLSSSENVEAVGLHRCKDFDVSSWTDSEGTSDYSSGTSEDESYHKSHVHLPIKQDLFGAKIKAKHPGVLLQAVNKNNKHNSTSCKMNRVDSMPMLVATISTTPHTFLPIDSYCDTNPDEFLKRIIESNGYSSSSCPASSLIDFFHQPTTEEIAGYNNELICSIRCENISALREMMETGRPLQCSNRFGESVVHMACRKGSTKIVRFMLDEANLSIRVCDDYGRTPLHDACWTREPEFELMKLLIERDPDLLLVSDKRGHTPFGYVRREHWGSWCRFLEEYRELLVPREIVERNVIF